MCGQHAHQFSRQAHERRRLRRPNAGGHQDVQRSRITQERGLRDILDDDSFALRQCDGLDGGAAGGHAAHELEQRLGTTGMCRQFQNATLVQHVDVSHVGARDFDGGPDGVVQQRGQRTRF